MQKIRGRKVLEKGAYLAGQRFGLKKREKVSGSKYSLNYVHHLHANKNPKTKIQFFLYYG
jgi:hypothetical protein